MELPCVYVDPHKSRANRTYMDLLHGRSFIILSLFDFHKKRCFGINVDRKSWWQKKSKGLASCQMPGHLENATICQGSTGKNDVGCHADKPGNMTDE